VVSLAFALAFFPDEVNLTPLSVLIAITAGVISILGFNVYMDGFVPADVGSRLRPNEGLAASVQNMVRFFTITVLVVIFWSIGMVALGVSVGAAALIWLAIAFHHGSDTVLSHGGIPFMQHLYLRYQLHRENVIPKNYANFLDYAAQLILLSKVGGGYIFIHRYLLEYFADLDAAEEVAMD
jgi:hypothetical protein